MTLHTLKGSRHNTMATTKKAVATKKAAKKAPVATKKAAKKAPVATKKAPVATKKAAKKAPVVAEAPTTKKAQIIAMLKNGATITELMNAVGWLRHTTRAYVSVMSRTTHPITTTLVNNERFYKLT